MNKRRKQQKRAAKPATLNLVSLMDIFTILVFFLMINSSEVEVLQTTTQIKLPDSASEQKPKNRLIVSVSADDLVVQGRPVAKVADLIGMDTLVIDGLRDELNYQASRKDSMPEGGFEVTIMGDRTLPYWLLKKVMYTCANSDFARISLAVNKIETPLDEVVSRSEGAS